MDATCKLQRLTSVVRHGCGVRNTQVQLIICETFGPMNRKLIMQIVIVLWLQVNKINLR